MVTEKKDDNSYALSSEYLNVGVLPGSADTSVFKETCLGAIRHTFEASGQLLPMWEFLIRNFDDVGTSRVVFNPRRDFQECGDFYSHAIHAFAQRFNPVAYMFASAAAGRTMTLDGKESGEETDCLLVLFEVKDKPTMLYNAAIEEVDGKRSLGEWDGSEGVAYSGLTDVINQAAQRKN